MVESQTESKTHEPTIAPKNWPVAIQYEGERAQKRFLEFFTAQIRNENTREAYYRACCQFFEWCESKSLGLRAIEPMHVAAYIETFSKPNPKLRH